MTSNKNSSDIVIPYRWQNQADNSWKCPTSIAYRQENLNLNRNQWGFEIGPGVKQYVWTKLLLDSHTRLEQHDDPLLKEMYGSGFLTLPPNKTAKDVAKDFMTELYKHCTQKLIEDFGKEAFDTMPMECWVTVPAIWSHVAENDTREAAKAAGFGSRSFDSVNIIKEPEAAALSALERHVGSKAVTPVKVRTVTRIVQSYGN